MCVCVCCAPNTNIFAIPSSAHEHRWRWEKRCNNTDRPLNVCVPVSAVWLCSHLSISTFNSWFIFVVCFLTYFPFSVCCLFSASFRCHFFGTSSVPSIGPGPDFVTKAVVVVAPHSPISRWCYKMGIVVCSLAFWCISHLFRLSLSISSCFVCLCASHSDSFIRVVMPPLFRLIDYSISFGPFRFYYLHSVCIALHSERVFLISFQACWCFFFPLWSSLYLYWCI